MAVFVEEGHEGVATLEDFELEGFYLVAVGGGGYLFEEGLVAAVFGGVAQGCDVGDGEVYVVGVVGAVEYGGLAAFADAGGYPLFVIYGMECFVYLVEVVGGVAGCEVLPVFGVGGGFEEVAVFDEQEVGVEQVGEFFVVFFI